MIVPIKQNGDRDIIGKLNEAIKVMGKEEEEEEESFSAARATEERRGEIGVGGFPRMAKCRERRGFDIYWANSPDSLVLTNARQFKTERLGLG